MVTSDELARMLHEVSVADVAREARVSQKTIYRLRHKETSPSLRTLERLLAAIAVLKRMQPAKQAA